MDNTTFILPSRDQDTTLLIFVQNVDFKTIEKMVSNKEYNLKTLLDQEEIDRLDYNKRMKLAQVKISLNAKFKDTTEVKYK